MSRGKSHLPTTLPARKRLPGALSEWRIDRRSLEARELAADLAVFCQDLGGVEHLSAMEKTLLERLVYLRRQLLQHESEVLAGRAGTLEPNAHTAMVNGVLGLAKALGLQRRAKDAGSLSDYLRERAAASAAPARSESPSQSIEVTDVPVDPAE